MRHIGMMVLAGALLVASQATAADKYGTAGCGLGSMVFGNQGGMIQIVAATDTAPAVVGTGRATERIPDGARVRVDGGRGVVTILG